MTAAMTGGGDIAAPADGRTAISLRDLSVVYGSGPNAITAVEQVNLDIREGEFLAVLGPSGCGKSSLLKVLSGLLKPASGAVDIAGAPVSGPRADVGIVFQAPTLLPWKTVIENVCLPGRILKRDPRQTREHAERMLDLVGLSGFLGKYPNQLSGGMAQRAGIARGLAQDPAVMLMDEPFGALDAMTRERMNLDLLDIWAETRKTIVFITHSIGEAVLLADRVAVMSSRPGRVVDIVDIDLPRPRNMAMMSTEAFGKYTSHLRGCFNASGDL